MCVCVSVCVCVWVWVRESERERRWGRAGQIDRRAFEALNDAPRHFLGTRR